MSAWTCRCGARVGHNAPHCGGCHLTFTCDSAFDAHRVGPAVDRRCLRVGEMLLDGWRLALRGWTNTPEMPDDAITGRRRAENRAGPVAEDPPTFQAVYGTDPR